MFCVKTKIKSISKDNKKKERDSISPFKKLYNSRSRKNNLSLNLKEINPKNNVNINKINIRDFINQAKKNTLKNRISFHQKNSISFSRAETDSNILKINQSMNLGNNSLNKSKEKKKLNISKIPLRNKPKKSIFSYSIKNVQTEENKINSREILKHNFLKNFPKDSHTNTTFIKNSSTFKNYYFDPIKLYNESGRTNSKNKNEKSETIHKNDNWEKLINLKEEFNKIENRIKNNLNNNITYSKSKRYNIIQNIFEETIKILPEENKNFFKSILTEIHDIVSDYCKENKRLKDENEIFRNKVFTLEKEQMLKNKIINEKEKEIEFLKKKIITQEQFISESTNLSIVSSIDKEKKNYDFKDNEDNKIDKYNKKNYKDLNALYFLAKIKMNSDHKFIAQSLNGQSIPPLNLNFEDFYEEEKKKNYEKLSFIEKVKLSLDLD